MEKLPTYILVFIVLIVGLFQLSKDPFLDKVSDWKERAANGDPESLYQLSRVYEFGLGGIQQDLIKAINLKTDAARRGHTKAKKELQAFYNER